MDRPLAAMTDADLRQLVLKQRRLYGDALSRVAALLSYEGFPGLAEVVLDVQEQYGLGDHRSDSRLYAPNALHRKAERKTA